MAKIKRSRFLRTALAPLDTHDFATYPQEQPEDGALLKAFSRTRTMPMQRPSGYDDVPTPPDPAYDIIGGKPQRMPINAGPRQLQQTTYPMQRRQFTEDSEPKDPVPLVMSYDQARDRGYIDGQRPIEYVKPLTEPRRMPQGSPMIAGSRPAPSASPPNWQRQAAGMFSMGGRAAPSPAIAPNTAPPVAQQRLMGMGVPRDRLAEVAGAGGTRGILQRPGSVSSPFQRQPTAIETADSPQSLLDAMRKKQGMPREILGQTTMEDAAERRANIEAQSRFVKPARIHNPTQRTVTVDGEEFAVSDGRTPGSYGGRLPETRVGIGRQSNGMTGGGGIGSSLMMSGAAIPGMAMGGLPQRQQPMLTPRPMKGTAPISEGDFASAWEGRKMTASQDTPETQANRSAFATAMGERKGLVKKRGIARGQAREERMQFSRDREQYGERGALVNAFQRQGVDPTRAMAMMQGNMQWLSEDNRQTRAATEFGEANRLAGQRESREQLQMRWTPRLAEAQAILNNPAATITEKNRAKQTMEDYDRSLTTAFGGETGATATTTPPPATGPQTAPEGTVPFGPSGAMVYEEAMARITPIAANYRSNPAQVGSQIVQQLGTDEFAHLTNTQKEAILKQVTGNQFATMADPSGRSLSEPYQRNVRRRSPEFGMGATSGTAPFGSSR